MAERRGATGPGFVPVPDELLAARARLAEPGVLALAAARPPQGKRAAAVLILLSQGEHGYQLVLVEKRAELRNHAGQVAFPGGGIEPDDASPIAAALREAAEEVGVSDDVEVLGVLPAAHIPRSGFDVTSVVAWWTNPQPLAVVDAEELSAVHVIAVDELLDPANRCTWVLPAGFEGPAFMIGELYIWGFTAYLLDELFELLGWTKPWPRDRHTEIPARFLAG
ncbi:8-oxo-dGTP pyrophosphatase MutT (NUDIX family) [Propionicimonas paludicola]|uniref:8-oxo-dGTP pyrophosphatase MutT (NUDIX family) n=1 Tax=Propionicimonas paludicola TaxID=185243 RepID=A0A2A9CTK4_9ACTN|nr:CoA pyrophosphatase [Propionicimonas paludicola]PFG17764.1 8-oxo-dGTP pyrophosphatase MutT (NUDIX family) [Propionicimonas paludicola]